MLERTSMNLEDVGLPAVEQVGFVVRDMDAALALYGPLFGPFVTMETTTKGANYRGRTCDVTLKLAIGFSGDTEMELIQWVDGESPHREFIDQGREGIHHIRFGLESAEEMQAAMDGLAAHGFQPIWDYRSRESSYAYLEHESQRGLLIELLTMAPEVKAGYEAWLASARLKDSG
jgi:catechol 2,3-dioxygenase-like lactoylglutathione lyase family enzyme